MKNKINIQELYITWLERTGRGCVNKEGWEVGRGRGRERGREIEKGFKVADKVL